MLSRSFALTIAASIAITSLSGCGGSSTSEDPEGSTSTTTTESSTASQTSSADHGGTDTGDARRDSEAEIAVRPATLEQYKALLQQHQDKVVLVDFWATWCVPCMEGFHHTVELHKQYGDQGLAVISVSVDDVSESEQVLAFLNKQQASFQNVIAAAGSMTEVFDAFELEGVPMYRVYDRGGKLHKEFGVDPTAEKQFTPEDIKQAVAELLAPSAS